MRISQLEYEIILDRLMEEAMRGCTTSEDKNRARVKVQKKLQDMNLEIKGMWDR